MPTGRATQELISCLVTGIRNHDCLESDMFPATDNFINFQSIYTYCLESDNMVNTSGLCMCGCGSVVPLAKVTDNRKGLRKGEPLHYLPGHRLQGTHMSAETKHRLSVAHKGKPKPKISEIQKGKPGFFKGKKHSELSKKKMSVAKHGKTISEEHKLKISNTLKGRIPWNKGRNNLQFHSHETRRKMSLAHKGSKGENWKGGISDVNKRIRLSLEYRLWRRAVFKRDNYTCQKCGAKHEKGNRSTLHPHHIKLFSEYPDLRFEVSNGMTLCTKCHKKEHRLKSC